MNAADSPSKREKQLPDLDSLDVQSLKALVLAKQAELDSRTTEIENLKLLVLKLKRMHFGPRSEKYDQRHPTAGTAVGRSGGQPGRRRTSRPSCPPRSLLKQQLRRKPARRPLPAELPRETETIAPEQEACPDCGGTLRHLGEDVSETLEYVPARFKVIRTVRPKLSCAWLLADRAGAGAESADRPRLGRARTAGACAGSEVCRSSAALPASGDLSAGGRRTGPLDTGRLGGRREPDAAAAGGCAEEVCAERGETARR